MIAAKNDAEQCTHVGQHGRCRYQIHAGAKSKCLHHGGVPEAERAKAADASSYRLQTYQARMNQHMSHSELKNIRGEVAILRMLVENKLNLCKDDYDLMLQSAGISDLIAKINVLVTSCHRLEQSSGELMDKQTLANFASDLIDRLSGIVDDGQMAKITEELLNLMEVL